MSSILPAAISCILQVLRSRVLSSLPLSLGAAFLCLATSSLPAQQAAMSIVAPATPTYVDAVTGVFTIPGQPTASGTVGYSVDGGATATADLVNGNAYLNLGQFAKGQHVLKIETVGSPGAVVPPPVNFMVTDQALTFVGTEGLLYPSGYTSINAIISRSRALAIDSKDTVYIADDLLNQILLIDVLGNFTYLPIKTLPSPISGPAGLAFDSKENLFIADSGNSRVVKYTPDGLESVLPLAGLGHSGQLVIDKPNNLLYVVDQDNNRVLRYDLNAGTFTNAVTGAKNIRSIAVDRSGVLLLSDDLLGALRVGTGTPIYSPVQYQYGIFADREGNTYVSDRETNAVFRIDPEGHQTEVSDGHVPSYGAAEDSQGKLYFLTGGANVVTFAPFGSLAPGVLRTGNPSDNSLLYAMPAGVTSLSSTLAPASEFTTNLNAESCPQAEYPLFQTWGVCSIPLYLTSSAPGVTVGDVQTTLSGGPTITTLLYGNAVGSAPAFSPGTQTQTPSGATVSAGVALDQLGNYYVSDAAGNNVYKTSSGVTRALGFSGLSKPGSLAVDGTGAVYVLDSGNNRIAKLDSSASQTAPVVAGTGNPISDISAFAIDGGGQIYFAGQSGGSSSLYLYDRTGQTSLVASGLSRSISLALDPYGDIYSLQADGSLIRVDVSRKLSTLAPAGTFSSPAGLAVDASETAYIAQSESSVITLLHPDWTKLSISVPALAHAAGIAIDGTGNILAADSATNQFIFVNRTHQDFNFGDVVVNTTKTFTSFFTNSGTQPFIVEDLPGDRYFMPVTTPDACGSSAATTNIPAAGSCNLSYTTSPTQLGPNAQYFRVTTDASLDFDTFTEDVISAVAVPALTPANADFGTITIGHTGTAQMFTLSNSGGAPLAITSIGLSGTNAGDYSITANTCGASLAAGASCVVTLNFKPAEPGTGAATLSVVDKVGTQTASLTGKGIAHPISISPASYDFGLVTATNYKYQDFTLTNVSSVSTSIDLPSITEDGSVFTFATSPFCGSIAPGAACTIRIKFDPLAAGAYSGTLNITDAGGPQAISLKGSSVIPSITLTPASFNYGAVTLGNFLDQAFILKNTSDADIVFYSAMINQTGSDFSFVTAPDCTQILPGATCTFNVRYYPSAIVNSAATLVLTGTALNLTASLTGHSILPTGTLSPAKFDFGAVTVGNFLDQSFTFKNTSNGFISISSSAVTGNGFSIITPTSMAGAPNCARLNPGDTCVYTVRYMPITVSSSTGTFTLVDTAGTQIARLSGHAILPTGTLTPASFNYGTLPLYNFLDQSFTFTNTSNGFISISSSAVAGNGFSIITPTSMASAPNCARLNPGDTCVYTVRYLPTTVGPSLGTFTLIDTAGVQTAVLEGTGVADAPQLVLSPSRYSFGAVSAGSTETQVVTLTNAGTAQAHFSVDVGPSVGDLQLGPTGNTCQTALSPSESCSITIQITGAAAGGAQIAINVTGNSGTNSVSARLVGFGADTNATPSFIDLGNGFTTDSLTLNGAAAVNTGFLQLTQNQAAQASSAFYPTAMSTTQFSTNFAFQLLDPLADGITFTIQGDKPNAIGSSGTGLGYQGIAKSIALKFGLRDATGANDNSTGIYVNGAAPTTPAISLAGSGIDLHSGHIFQLGIQYDGTTEAITLTDTSTQAVWTTNVAEDIPSIIGGNTAYFGFTAGTGAATASADVAKPTAATATTSLSTTANILNWNYVNQSATVTDPITLSPATLNFGSITVAHTGTAQTVTLANQGGTAIAIASIGLTGTNAGDYSITANTCGASLAAGASCAVTLNFKPTATATRTATLSVVDQVGTQTASLTGKGIAHPIAISPASLNFGQVAVGQITFQAFTLTNVSSTPTEITLPSISQNGISFQFSSSRICGAIAPGASCTIQIQFNPVAAGIYSASFNVTDSGGTQTVGIQGKAVPPPNPGTLTPTTLNFGNITVGSTSGLEIAKLTNTGTAPLTIASITASDPVASGGKPGQGRTDDPGILVRTSFCSTAVTPGNYCKLEVTLAPGKVGPYSGNVVINYYLGDGTLPGENFTTTLNIIGTGVAPGVTLTPASADFGSVPEGQTSSPKMFTVTNNTSYEVTLVRITTGSAIFLEQPGATCRLLQAGGSCTIPVVFAPVSEGSTSSTLSVSYIDSYGAAVTQTLSLTGTGVAVSITPANLDFGDVPYDTIFEDGQEISLLYFTARTVTVTNVSTSPIQPSFDNFSTADQDEFSLGGSIGTCYPGNVQAGPCGTCYEDQLLPGQSCTLVVDYTPFGVGNSHGGLYFPYTNASGEHLTATSSFTGTGVTPVFSPNSVFLDFGLTCEFNCDYEDPDTFQTLTLTNTSPLPITISGVTTTSPMTWPLECSYTLPYLDLAPACGSSTVPPGGSVKIYVDYYPGYSSNPFLGYTDFGRIIISTDAGPYSFDLAGIGFDALDPHLSFTPGQGFSVDSLALNGPSTVADGALQLTSGPSSAASSAFYPTPLPTKSFNTDFTFQLLDPTAEGITFTIQGDSPNAVGLGGGGLGYQGILKSLAVKFDLEDTAGEGVDSTGIYVNGAAPTVPAISLAKSGIDLHSGHLFDLSLSYDGTTMTITLTDTATRAVWTTKAAEDIPAIVGGNTAYFGFTAGSGTTTLNSNAAAEKPALAARPATAAATAAPATSKILSWGYAANGVKETAQTITFPSLPAQTYGAGPIHLAATATSGLPVSYSVKGGAKLSGSTLTITGAGEVDVTASQPGNASFASANSVTRSFTVAKAPLTVIANSLSRAVGSANPAFTYEVSGFVDGDSNSVVSGSASLVTTATSTSPNGSYPITFSTEGLTSTNYSFTYVAGTLTITSASCQSVNYSNGFTASGLSLNAGAKIDGGALELTDGGLFEARSAFFSTALPTTSFVTDFTFQITNPVADGMTFVIQSDNPKVVGQAGGGLGYAGIPHSVAIKVDLHNNAGEGTDSTGTFIDGAYPSVPSIDMTPAGINLHSGHIFAVHLAYNKAVTTGMITDTVTGVSASMNFPGNITQIVGNNAWFGFTAGTGANSATQKILTWSYSGGTVCSAQ